MTFVLSGSSSNHLAPTSCRAETISLKKQTGYVVNSSLISKKSIIFNYVIVLIWVYLTSAQLCWCLNESERRTVLELTSDNFDQQTKDYQVVVLNFYADWCPFSRNWKPVFKQAAEDIHTTHMNATSISVVFGQINCDKQTTLSQRFRITKFPTTKVVFERRTYRKEYRGARNVDSFKEYITKLLSDPIITINSHSDLMSKIDEKRGAFLMYSSRPDEIDKPHEGPEVLVYRRVAQNYRDECQFFYVTQKPAEGKVNPPDFHSLVFKPHHKHVGFEILYHSVINDYTSLFNWVSEQCVPLVREITFANAEELTENNLPLVILFYSQNTDKSYIEIYKRMVDKELREEANQVQFLIANGNVFSHPLKHIGATINDLPVLAIDNYKHLFKYNEPIGTISQPGKIKQFIADLFSGKLDREFHFGPDPITRVEPPSSAFNKLQPSNTRYTILHDEL